MIAENEPIVVSADWMMPIVAPPIAKGFVVLRNGTIQFVGSHLPDQYSTVNRYVLNGYAIVPGLINSHCHLEFSDLQSPISASGSFADWIGRLLAYRRSQSSVPKIKALARQAAIASGIRESYSAGVRWIVDMTTEPWEQRWISSAVAEIRKGITVPIAPGGPIVVQPCIEILDIAKPRLVESIRFAAEQLDAPKWNGVGEMGYAPHAPYSTSLATTQACVDLSRTHRRLATMHLAESADEVAWLERREGGFRELLSPILGYNYFEQIGQVSEHLESLSRAPRSLIAHGNYLSEGDLQVLAHRSRTMAIVHCPRTHLHFGHRYAKSQQYPLAQRQTFGVKHLLGTDSRASNPDLNLWSEAKSVRAEHQSLSSESILRMITIDAAEVLGIAPSYGSIREGALALLTAVKLPSISEPENHKNVLEHAYDRVLSPDTESKPLELVLMSKSPH